MIVRCGRCQSELEVAGAGEFTCPACGTRNAVRGPTAAGGAPPVAPNPFGVPDLGMSAPPGPEPELTWIRCEDCRRRFVVGEGLDEVACPACGRVHQVASSEPA